MATFSGIVQLIKDLAEQTSASDSDNLIIGSTTMKRITMANIAKYIKGKRKQSKSVVHGYGNSTISSSSTNGTYTLLPSFTSVGNGTLSSLYTKNTSSQIEINKTGLYAFQLRLGINSGTANKRVEVATYINNSRSAMNTSNYCTNGNYTSTFMTTILLDLTANDTVDFRIAPVDRISVNVTMMDIQVFALDWDGKLA
jgi:hypothetical protein